MDYHETLKTLLPTERGKIKRPRLVSDRPQGASPCGPLWSVRRSGQPLHTSIEALPQLARIQTDTVQGGCKSCPEGPKHVGSQPNNKYKGHEPGWREAKKSTPTRSDQLTCHISVCPEGFPILDHDSVHEIM